MQHMKEIKQKNGRAPAVVFKYCNTWATVSVSSFD